jgi:tetratricopeptide (TPR) repeat protein
VRGLRVKYRFFGCLLFGLLFYMPGFCFGQDVYNEQLNRGIRNNEPYSYILYKKAAGDPADARQLLSDAVKHSPDFPAVYFALAWRSFSISPDGIFGFSHYMMEGIGAYGRNFWWQTGIYGLFYISFLLAFVLTVAVVIAIRLPMDIELIRHDIKEDGRNLFMLGIILVFSFLGPVFFLAGALFVLGFYMKRLDRALVYVTLVFLTFSPLMLSASNRFFSLPAPEMRAIVSVNEGHGNLYAIDVLKGRADFPSRFSYALALKREGRCDEAMEHLKALIEATNDPRPYVNLGNCYIAKGDMEAAKGLYAKANEIKPSVRALYNLSQVYRTTFDYPKGDEYYLKAKDLDRDRVIRFTAISSTDPNRLVIDERLTKDEFWKFADGHVKDSVDPFTVNSYVLVISALFAIVLFFILERTVKNRAYRCVKCNVTICGVCSSDISWGNMCRECYTATVKLGSKETKERVARLLSIYEHQSKRRDTIRLLSFAPPGVAYIYAGRALLGAILLCIFLFFLIFVVLNPLFHTGLYGFSHKWLNLPLVLSMIALYALTNMVVKRRLDAGWL